MMQTKPIKQLVDDLPQKSVTVYMLQSLDYLVPGEWENLTGFDETIRFITGENDQQRIYRIGQLASELYDDPSQGYQRAMWLYQTIDRADQALGAAALASQVGKRIGFLSFLSRLTPKADTTQAIDLGLKLTVEMIAFALINGLPTDKASIMRFGGSLGSYSKENIMRMATLVSVDGVIPLGADFVTRLTSTLNSTRASDLERNGVYQKIKGMIPGNSAVQQLGFIQGTVDAAQDWMRSFQENKNLNRQQLVKQLKQYMDIADDKLEYVAAFIDMTTNYYAHTGTQSIARDVIVRAAE